MPHTSNHNGSRSALYATFKYKCDECDYEFRSHCYKNYETKIRLHWRQSHNANKVSVSTNFNDQAHVDEHNKIPVKVNTHKMTASLARHITEKK